MYRCTVLPAALYEAGGLFLVPFQDSDIHCELIGRWCNPLGVGTDRGRQPRMRRSNLTERRAQPGRIKRASDLGGETERDGKGERIETEEPLAAAEQADTICSWHSANTLHSRGKY